MGELIFKCSVLAVSIACFVAIAWALTGIVLGIGAEKRRARREQQAREIFEKVVSDTKAKAPSGIAQVNPMFLACMAPVLAGKQPAHACEVEVLTPSGMGSYVIACFDATVFERLVQPALEKEFGAS